jgi:hypothetical protein
MLVCVFFRTYLHTRPRVQRASGIPCSLHFGGTTNRKTRATSCRENANAYPLFEIRIGNRIRRPGQAPPELPSTHAPLRVAGSEASKARSRGRGWGVYQFTPLAENLLNRPHPRPLPAASRGKGRRISVDTCSRLAEPLSKRHCEERKRRSNPSVSMRGFWIASLALAMTLMDWSGMNFGQIN